MNQNQEVAGESLPVEKKAGDAVRKDESCTIRYVSLSGNHLVLRPHNQAYPVDVQPIELGQSFADYIVGRVCHVAIEA